MNRFSLSAVIKAQNGRCVRTRSVTVRASAEWNEVRIMARDKNALVATAYFDRGHTLDDKVDCAFQVRSYVDMFLNSNDQPTI